MTLSDCSITTPPQVEDGLVTFSVIHTASGEVFRCQMADFDAVSVTPELKDITAASEGDVRGLVAAAAREHADQNRVAFEAFFDLAVLERGDIKEI